MIKTVCAMGLLLCVSAQAGAALPMQESSQTPELIVGFAGVGIGYWVWRSLIRRRS